MAVRLDYFVDIQKDPTLVFSVSVDDDMEHLEEIGDQVAAMRAYPDVVLGL